MRRHCRVELMYCWPWEALSLSPGGPGCLDLTRDQEKCSGIYDILFKIQNSAGDPQTPEEDRLVIVFNWHSWLDSLADYVTRGAH